MWSDVMGSLSANIARSDGPAVNGSLEHFPAKWTPVRVKKMRQNKGLESFSDSIRSEKALGLTPLPKIEDLPSHGVQHREAEFDTLVIVGNYPQDEQLIRGGIEASVFGLAKTLMKRPSARSLNVISVSRVSCRKQISEQRLKIDFLPYPLGWEMSAPLLFPLVARRFSRFDRAVYHLHGTGPLVSLLCIYLRLTHRPCVLTVHGFLTKELADHAARAATLKARLQKSIYSYFERLALRWAGDIIVDTPYVERAIRYLVPGKINVIPQGVFIEQLEAAANANRQLARDIISVGVIERRKGHHHLIAAFAEIAASFPDSQLTIIGANTDPQYYIALVTAINHLRLEGRVRIIVNAARNEVLALMREARIFALHSQEESQGIALTEALITGLPVVATDVGGIPDVVTDGVDGLLSPFGDIPQFADHLAKLLADDDLLANFGIAAYRRREEFDWEAITPRIEQVYYAADAQTRHGKPDRVRKDIKVGLLSRSFQALRVFFGII
jgi:glycogen(starch) synthase